MQDVERGLPDDDERVPMTMSERTVWAYLVAVVLTSGVYLTVMVGRMLDEPVAQIEWVVPMLWTLGASVLGSILLTILITIGGSVWAEIAAAIRSAHTGTRDHRPHVTEPETTTDARDEDIDVRAGRALTGVLSVGFVGALVLAMVDADTFWIGNLLFVAGTIGAIVETTTKIRLYRRGF